MEEDYLVCHDTSSAARSKRTRLVHATSDGANSPDSGKDHGAADNPNALAICLGHVRGNAHARS